MSQMSGTDHPGFASAPRTPPVSLGRPSWGAGGPWPNLGVVSARWPRGGVAAGARPPRGEAAAAPGGPGRARPGGDTASTRRLDLPELLRQARVCARLANTPRALVRTFDRAIKAAAVAEAEA